MTKIKLIFPLALALLSVAGLSAQLNIGVDYYRLEENEKAKEYLNRSLGTSPAEANFYLGEIAFSEKNFTKAEEYYNKVLSVEAENIYGQIGLAKLKLKSDSKAAAATLTSIGKKNKKNADVFVAIGRAYFENDMFDAARKEISNAKKANGKNPDIYILEGDMILKDDVKRAGEAAGRYEMAIHFAPEYGLGYIKYALVYEHINSTLAIERMKTIIEKQPNYTIAYSALGKIYTQNGFYPQAIEMFKTYFKSDIYSVDDIGFYARALYFTDSFDEAKKIVNEGLQKAPDHFVLNRYLMYIDAKTKNIDEGLLAADKFFRLRDASGYIPMDYSMYAQILATAKLYNEAIAQYEKAIEAEPEKAEAYTEAMTIAREKRDYALAANYMKRLMTVKAQLSGDPEYLDDIVDINTLGYDYYSAGVTISRNPNVAEEKMADEAVVNELLASDNTLIKDSLNYNLSYFTKSYSIYNLNKADAVFDILIEHAPESYTGYRFKALTKHAINPDTEVGLAKPHYEKVEEIIINEEGELTAAKRRVLLEAYNYLGYYYYMKSDKENTILYWNKVLELDPDNKNAKLVLEDINK